MNIIEIGSRSLESTACAIGFIHNETSFDIWAALYDGPVFILSSSLEMKTTFDTGLRPLNDVICIKRDKLLIGVGGQGICVYDFDLNSVFDPYPIFSTNLYKVASLNSETIVSGGSDETLFAIDLFAGATQGLVALGEELHSISLHPINQHILYASGSGGGCYTAFLDYSTYYKRTIISKLRMRKVRTAFNSNGSKILQLDKYVRCFSFPELGNLWCFSGENGFVENTEETDWEASCAWSNPVFSPHSPNAFCGSETGKIYCWDINEGKVLGEIQAHTHQVENLAISPDGQHLASIGPDGTLKLWRLDA